MVLEKNIEEILFLIGVDSRIHSIEPKRTILKGRPKIEVHGTSTVKTNARIQCCEFVGSERHSQILAIFVKTNFIKIEIHRSSNRIVPMNKQD
jgi:hypothetical protein